MYRHPDERPDPPDRTVTVFINRKGLQYSAEVELRADRDECSAEELAVGVYCYDELAEWLSEINYGQLAERAAFKASIDRRDKRTGQVSPAMWNNNDTVKAVQLAGEHKLAPTDDDYIAEAIEVAR